MGGKTKKMGKKEEASLKTRRGNRERNKKKFLEVMEGTACNISTACAAVGICRMTYYKWKEEDGRFNESVSELHEARIDFAENKLMECIDNGELGAITFFLETKGKNRGYARKAVQDINLTSPPPGLLLQIEKAKKEEGEDEKN